MKPQAFRPSVLVLLLTTAFAHMQAAADTSAELETIEIKARSRDQRGADDVYRKNVSSVSKPHKPYTARKGYLKTRIFIFQVACAADWRCHADSWQTMPSFGR